jgi:hypothetical protein
MKDLKEKTIPRLLSGRMQDGIKKLPATLHQNMLLTPPNY